ncbi:hypothetical protein LTR53_000950 [Teratosphaeriaceae sp. CCFEE 6253]|nr:hypothetical protein LTR53_000950 [Teratosphaeriaceae sp. CCFEE 6253]
MSTKPLVLVTGATGLLGFRPYLKDIEFIRITDITASDAFDEGVKGADYVLHVASPVFDTTDGGGEVRDWQSEFYDPSVKGTISVLSAALKAPGIKRIVLTGSVVALEPREGSVVAGPSDVRALPPPEVLASFTDPRPAYVMSKTMSHIAVDDWARDHPQAHFDIVRVLPGYIQGANELALDVETILKSSSEGSLNAALGVLQDQEKPVVQVHIEDVSRAHVVALDQKKINGGQVLIAVSNNGTGWSWDAFVEAAEKVFPEEVKAGRLSPKKGQAVRPTAFDVSETYKALGYEFAGPEEMVRSVVGQYLEVTAK